MIAEVFDLYVFLDYCLLIHFIKWWELALMGFPAIALFSKLWDQTYWFDAFFGPYGKYLLSY